MSSLVLCLATQLRVIRAIILRDVGSRHGEGAAILYILLEPMIIFSVVVLIHEESGVAGATTETTMVFLLTGYVPHLLFRHAGLAGLTALNANTALLYHRHVHFLDLIGARLFVEISTVLVAFFIMCAGLQYYHIIRFPRYIQYVYLGWFYHIWFIVNASLIFAGLGLLWPLTRKMFQPLALLMLPAYAAFFMMSMMPTKVQYYLLFFPSANAAEIMRHGYFGESALTFYYIPYTTFACAIMTLVGFVCVFRGRQKLVL